VLTMKAFSCLTAMLLLASGVQLLHAESGKAIPEDAMTLYTKLADKVTPGIHTWTILEGDSISRNPDATEITIRADLQSRFSGQPLSAADVDTLTFMVLLEAVQHMDTLMKTERDEPGDLQDVQTQRLQVAFQRRGEFVETVSRLAKKISDAQIAAVQDLK